MAPAQPANHDPALLSQSPVSAAPQQPQQQSPMGINLPPGLNLQGIDANHLVNILRNIPVDAFKPGSEGGANKEDVAQILSNLGAQSYQAGPAPYPTAPHPSVGMPGINDPGPSSHPRGPPNMGQLGQLSAVAVNAAPASVSAPRPPQLPGQPPQEGGEDRHAASQASVSAEVKPATPATNSRRGSRLNAQLGTDEWTRQRKDNHKEVERRRRGNINEGINELGRIVPNGSGEKAKGAILSRAVQYIHHLKENEARNIEKWTLEKLLMDQAMGDLQTQLEEYKKMWEEERQGRQRAEGELEALRGAVAAAAQGAQGSSSAQAVHARTDSASLKRDAESAEVDREAKKARVE
ncbi:hypothetical protein H0H92_016090 [Tricholoma furcatifolium]|nr:hypothetical protein H0H92_016090 [Tricholoma furcatifolium]